MMRVMTSLHHLQRSLITRCSAKRSLLLWNRRDLVSVTAIPTSGSGDAQLRSNDPVSTGHADDIRPPVRNALVVGGGVAGLATAACLGRIGVQVTIALGDGEDGATSMMGGRGGNSKPDPATGIWTHGLECLEKLGVLEQLETEGRYMGEAGYKQPSGKWLARPSRPLANFKRQEQGQGVGERGEGRDASILFVRESKLLEALRSSLAPRTEVVNARIDDLRWEDDHDGDLDNDKTTGEVDRRVSRKDHVVTARHAVPTDGNIVDAAAGNLRHLPGSWTGPFDLVVGADGPRSFVRRRVLAGRSGYLDGNAAAAAAAADPECRGYVVYRGVCNGSSDEEGVGPSGWGLDSFQTWGPGLRFASVPLAGKERMWFATTPADSTADNRKPSQDGYDQTVPSHASIKKKLFETFEGWHYPVADLIRATPEGDILSEDARAMTTVGLRLAASAASAARGGGSGGEGGPGRVGGRSVLVGDAAHTLDPVLAQGAGVALEDAFLLAHRVHELNKKSITSSASLRSSPAADGGDLLEAVLRQYGEERLQRALLLSNLSDLSQALGQLRSPQLIQLRDVLMAITPGFLKSRAFDTFMGVALSGGASGVVHAVVESAGVLGGKRYRGYRTPNL